MTSAPQLVRNFAVARPIPIAIAQVHARHKYFLLRMGIQWIMNDIHSLTLNG